jgi:hypothetical protein
MSEPVNTPRTEGHVGTNSENESPGEARVIGSQPPGKQDPDRKSAPAESNQRKAGNMWMWLVGISCVLAAELYIYGHDGWVRVCVGLEGMTDLTLMERAKHGDGQRGFPICAEQLNLGMYSGSEEAAREALDVACARGATLLRSDKADCLRKEHGWIRRVDRETIPPWDPRLYRRLFFLD